jgi:hypothetical protein
VDVPARKTENEMANVVMLLMFMVVGVGSGAALLLRPPVR